VPDRREERRVAGGKLKEREIFREKRENIIDAPDIE
jgi:hypothetical protein